MSEAQTFLRKNILYQPTLTSSELELIRNGNFDEVIKRIRESSEAERVSVDRLALIMRSLPGRIENLTFLDLGCANGFFCNSLSLLGAASTTGVDSDVHKNVLGLSIDSALLRARMDAETYGAKSVRFVDFDLNELMSKSRPEFVNEVTLFLSVFHHMFYGYGFLNHTDQDIPIGDRAAPVFNWLDKHTKKALYFETHEGIFSDWNRETIPNRLRELTSFRTVKLLADSDGYEKTPRGVWLCTR